MKNYNSNASLKASSVQVNFTQDQIQEYIKCKADPIYFITNYCKIISLDRGLIPFELFEYQKRFIHAIHTNNRVVSMQPRQMGKSQTVAAYILHYTLFNEHKTAAILANKASAAREIMSRYQLMYEQLPMWLQQGVEGWNKGDIELENGSKVFTAATSGSGIRGKSCVTGDTKVCILENGVVWYTEISNIISGNYNRAHDNCVVAVYRTTNTISEESFISIRETGLNTIRKFPSNTTSCFDDGYIGSGSSLIKSIETYGPECFTHEILGVYNDIDKIPHEFLIQHDQRVNKSCKVLSSDGFKDFSGFINQGISKSLYRVSFTDGSAINATGCHRFMMHGGSWAKTADIERFSTLSTGKIVKDVVQIENEVVYDALEVADTHDYWTNGVISHNCNLLYVDETAIIPNNVADDFFTSTYPTISSGKTTKVILTSTPLGYNHFWNFWQGAEHGTNGFVPVRVHYWDHPDRDEAWAKQQRELLGDIKFTQEILCEFLGSSLTLINADAFGRMVPRRFIHSKDGLDILDAPEQDHIYMLIADTAKGVGGDYSAFVVIDITTVPYKVVAKYRDNHISPMLYPNVIRRIASEYNEAFVLIEINSSEQVAIILRDDLEYENVLTVYRNQRGQTISEGFGGGNTQSGVVTDKKVKRIGCTALKALVEENKLIVQDPDIISEISVFIEKNGSYQADEGYHDDLVMPLVLFGWVTTNVYFKDISNVNLRQAMYQARIDQIESDMVPVGWITTGLETDQLMDF